MISFVDVKSDFLIYFFFISLDDLGIIDKVLITMISLTQSAFNKTKQCLY